MYKPRPKMRKNIQMISEYLQKHFVGKLPDRHWSREEAKLASGAGRVRDVRNTMNLFFSVFEGIYFLVL